MEKAARIARVAVPVSLENASRFLDPSNRCKFSRKQIHAVVVPAMKKVPLRAWREAGRLLNASPKQVRWQVRGHFLCTAVLHFLSQQVKSELKTKLDLSYTALFTTLAVSFDTGDPASVEYGHYRDSIAGLLSA